MTTNPQAAPAFPPLGSTMYARRAVEQPQPRSVTLPDAGLVARFSPEAAERITEWRHALWQARGALQAADDAKPGGRDYLAAIHTAGERARFAVLAGEDTYGDEETSLTEFLRDEPPRRVARAVAAVATADALLDQLLDAVSADDDLRQLVDAAYEEWLARAIADLDGDAPGIRDVVEARNKAEWAPLAGLLSWLGNPRVPYRARPTSDARLAEALVMHDLRRGREAQVFPYSGGVIEGSSDRQTDGFGPTGRFGDGGQVLHPIEVPAPATGIDPPPIEAPPMPEKARSKWGWLAS